MATMVRDQLAFDERRLDVPELEEALEDRLEAKKRLGEVRKDYDRANEIANAEIEKLELPADGDAVRVGRFRITRASIPSQMVEFERKASTRIRITLVGGHVDSDDD